MISPSNSQRDPPPPENIWEETKKVWGFLSHYRESKTQSNPTNNSSELTIGSHGAQKPRAELTHAKNTTSFTAPSHRLKPWHLPTPTHDSRGKQSLHCTQRQGAVRQEPVRRTHVQEERSGCSAEGVHCLQAEWGRECRGSKVPRSKMAFVPGPHFGPCQMKLNCSNFSAKSKQKTELSHKQFQGVAELPGSQDGGAELLEGGGAQCHEPGTLGRVSL